MYFDGLTLKKEKKLIPATHTHPDLATPDSLKSALAQWLDDDKAEDITTIDLRGQTALADFMIIATGRSTRQVAALAENLKERLAARGFKGIRSEGESTGDWIIVDTGDVIIHIFRPEVREFYNIEQMWQMGSNVRPVDNGRGLRA